MQRKKSWLRFLRGDLLDKRLFRTGWLGFVFSTGFNINLSRCVVGIDWHSSIFHPDDATIVNFYLGPIWVIVAFRKGK